MILSRRRVLCGLLAAPIVVRAGLIMPVKALEIPQNDVATELLRVNITPSEWNSECRIFYRIIRQEMVSMTRGVTARAVFPDSPWVEMGSRKSKITGRTLLTSLDRSEI